MGSSAMTNTYMGGASSSSTVSHNNRDKGGASGKVRAAIRVILPKSSDSVDTNITLSGGGAIREHLPKSNDSVDAALVLTSMVK